MERREAGKWQGGQGKLYPYKEGGGQKNALAMLKCGGGGGKKGHPFCSPPPSLPVIHGKY